MDQLEQHIDLLRRLQKPTGRVDVVLDTDTYNEIDDQFALAFLVKSAPKLNLRAVYAAPFLNEKSTGPRDGMEKSYDEILKVLSLMDRDDLAGQVYKGSTAFLPNETEPVDSPAARHLASLAMEYTAQNPLYIIAIGAITNVASALLLQPEIKDRTVLIWMGGNALHWPHTREFNMKQDIAAARIVFGCGIPLVQLPCMGVVSAFTISGPELDHWLHGKNPLCTYLAENTRDEAARHGAEECWTRIIWDVTAVAWLLDGDYMLDTCIPSPIPQYDHHYSQDPARHPIKYVYHINRDALVTKLFQTLAEG